MGQATDTLREAVFRALYDRHTYATSGDPLGPDPQCWWPGPGGSAPRQ